MTNKEFILSIKDAAISACKGLKLFPSIIIAQACLESNYGASGLSVQCNNFFGIKAGSHWSGPVKVFPTKEYDKTKGEFITINAAFAAYTSFEQCLAEHNAMLQRVPVYAAHGLFKCTSPEGQAVALRAAGYATDPGYPQKLIAIINEFNLKQYDTFSDGSSVAFS